MIFLGDFASYHNSIRINFESRFTDSTILLNCEGYLVEDKGIDNTVFNNVNIFKNLSNDYNLILNLSNNHLMDIENGVAQSLELAKKYKLKNVGAGLNITEAKMPLIETINDTEVAIISGGWDVIGCKPATNNSEGVAPLDSKRILKQVEEQNLLGRKVVVYLHWGYELEIYPQPTHRKLAKNCIDSGADIVLGCHSHCIQGYEKYKNKYIFYGLGNSVFEENYYFNGKISFPIMCKNGLAVSWDPISNKVTASLTTYENNVLSIQKFTHPDSIPALKKLSTFSDLNDFQYLKFFIKNRRKRKLLPVFYEDDFTLRYNIKCNYMKLRTSIISNMFNLGLKGSSR